MLLHQQGQAFRAWNSHAANSARKRCRASRKSQQIQANFDFRAALGAFSPGPQQIFTFQQAQREGWDFEKEAGRVYRRMQYGFLDWKRHRSQQRYFRHLESLLRGTSRVLRGVWGPVFQMILVSTGVLLYGHLQHIHFLPAFFPLMPKLSWEPFQLTSFAMALLLVFRTNSSYARWEEGRRRFGVITNCCRDLARQADAWFDPADKELRGLLARWLVALCRSALAQLRDDTKLKDSLKGLLRPSEVSAVLASPHPANYCIKVISHIVANAPMDSQHAVKMDDNVSQMVDALSACERIFSTPIPLSYTRHTARCLFLWLLLLPFALWYRCGVSTIPICGLVSFMLLGIEEIGVQIEEPFSILALDTMVMRIEQHVNGSLLDQQTLHMATLMQQESVEQFARVATAFVQAAAATGLSGEAMEGQQNMNGVGPPGGTRPGGVQPAVHS